MRRIVYNISEIEPYINWLYFYHAWGLSGKKEEVKLKMRQEAEKMLSSWEGKYHTHALLRIMDAYSEGDDIIVETENQDLLNGCANTEMRQVRLPMLRQQHPSVPGAPNFCLADFIRPRSLKVSGVEKKTEKMQLQDIASRLGVFCCTVDASILDAYRNHEYLGMMAQLLCDRLAEATAELLHEQTRKTYWGYAPDEHLTPQQLHCEEYQGIRPAIGYPSLPELECHHRSTAGYEASRYTTDRNGYDDTSFQCVGLDVCTSHGSILRIGEDRAGPVMRLCAS